MKGDCEWWSNDLIWLQQIKIEYYLPGTQNSSMLHPIARLELTKPHAEIYRHEISLANNLQSDLPALVLEV